MDSKDSLLAGSTRTDGQLPIEEIGDNDNPMDFGNPQNEGSSLWDVVFPHSVYNHTHNMPKAYHTDMEKLSFVSSVKDAHVEITRLHVILCVVEDQWWDMMKEKKTLEKEKLCLVAKAKKLRKQVSDTEAGLVTLDQAKVNLEKDKEVLAKKEKEIMDSLENFKNEKRNLQERVTTLEVQLT